ncbi:WYL domain-containing protein [Streptomyces sp. NPDC057496]|uniref:WYL domain-containing protein n=1 Tax=Streptomyces sp. NPDC057496 TaxID=3346149 RepID=UPI0036CDD16A
MGRQGNRPRPGWYQDSEETPRPDAVASTVRGRQRMRIRYERWATPYGAIRTADPCGVVLKAGRWYLVAGSVRGARTCQVSRISERCCACRPRRSRASGR